MLADVVLAATLGWAGHEPMDSLVRPDDECSVTSISNPGSSVLWPGAAGRQAGCRNGKHRHSDSACRPQGCLAGLDWPRAGHGEEHDTGLGRVVDPIVDRAALDHHVTFVQADGFLLQLTVN